MLFYITSLGPPVGDPTAMYAPPLRYKREVLAVHDRLQGKNTSSLELSRGKAIQHTVDVGYYAPASRTTQNPAVFIVFLSEIELVAIYPPSTHPLGLGGCIPPPDCGLPHHDTLPSGTPGRI